MFTGYLSYLMAKLNSDAKARADEVAARDHQLATTVASTHKLVQDISIQSDNPTT
jgi:hypothetical protein